MKVSKEGLKIAEKILDTFDPDRLKQKQIDNIDRRQAELESKLKDLAKPIETTQSKYEKWDIIDK